MKSHTKSRRGCVQCKHRKVKCDETLPCCDRCRRRHEHCSYLDECYGSPSAAAAANNTTTAASGLVTTPGSSSSGGPGSGGPNGTGPHPPPAPGLFSSSSASVSQHHQYHTGAASSHHGFPPRAGSSAGRLGLLDTSSHGHLNHHAMSQSPAITPTPLFTAPSGILDGASSDSYLVDMELLHFYLTCTYKTLWGRPEGKLVWRDVIFREALAHPALLNGLLTTAALHRIVLLGQSHGPAAAAVYHGVALYKQRQALEGLVVLLRSLNPDSCRAIFPLSMMVSFWSFVSREVPEELGILTTLDVNGGINPAGNHQNGSQQQYQQQQQQHHSPADSTHDQQQPPGTPRNPNMLPPMKSVLDLFVELIRRIRAVQTIAQESQSWLTQSQFLPLMATPTYEALPPLPEGISAALHAVDAHVQRTPRIAAMLSGLDSKYSLHTMYQLSRSPDWLELVTGWPMTLPQSFVDELQRRNHAALTVFAYWLGCFQVLEDRWWAKGWTAALMQEIEVTVRGGEWAGLVDWVRMYLSIIK
ncbi:hypothetical protein Micbo1qcDRAFT_168882 [Microdochium bolleyi]|uniref:Zn(2)-C6 fungal-type domain-containing protein n=1 Tax=Microdochium bolleyi TaxID=196109 RepID=A0A136IM83_9PEZI|nr:hypothetical protein Micbo1qcDRAFT_168882 [Microdochium bolleyi]